jgi:hypothetical protein
MIGDNMPGFDLSPLAGTPSTIRTGRDGPFARGVGSLRVLR